MRGEKSGLVSERHYAVGGLGVYIEPDVARTRPRNAVPGTFFEYKTIDSAGN